MRSDRAVQYRNVPTRRPHRLAPADDLDPASGWPATPPVHPGDVEALRLRLQKDQAAVERLRRRPLVRAALALERRRRGRDLRQASPVAEGSEADPEGLLVAQLRVDAQREARALHELRTAPLLRSAVALDAVATARVVPACRRVWGSVARRRDRIGPAVPGAGRPERAAASPGAGSAHDSRRTPAPSTQPARRTASDGGPVLRVAIATAAPRRKAATWGDHHLAVALGDALVAAGHQVRVECADDGDDPDGSGCDVRVVVRGIRRVARTEGQRHVLWVLSHPEQVTDAELDEADLVAVASAPFAAHLRTRTATPVAVLHQFTDPRRFSPPVSRRPRHDLVVVANTRGVLRPGVAAAIEAGLRPAIYGSGWAELVDPRLIVAEHVPNEQLAGVYGAAEAVLADHWPSMRVWGFPSNRLFDVSACATPVLCDDVAGLDEVFGGTVATWRDADDLARAVADLRAAPSGWRRRASDARSLVVAAHTAPARADELIRLIRSLG